MYVKNCAVVLAILVCSKYVQTSPLEQEQEISTTSKESVSVNSNENGSSIRFNSSPDGNAITEPSSGNNSTIMEPTYVNETTTMIPPTTTEYPETIVGALVSPPNLFDFSQKAVPLKNSTALFRKPKSKLIFWQIIYEPGYNWKHAYVNQSNFQEVVPKNTFVYWRFTQSDGSIMWQCAYAFDYGFTHLEPANLNTFISSLHDFEERKVFWQETTRDLDIMWESAYVNKFNFEEKIGDGTFIYWVNPENDGLWQCAYVKAKDGTHENRNSLILLPSTQETPEENDAMQYI